MALDDLPLRMPDAPLPPGPTWPGPVRQRPSSGPSRWIVLGAIVVMVGALLAMWWLGRAQPVPTAPAFTNKTDVAVASLRPKNQPMDLPPVDESDPLLRRLLSVLSTHPLLTRLLATPAIVRGATLAVVQIGDGKTPAATFGVLRPSTRLTITGTASGPIDPKSYHRWDAQTAALVSLPPAELAQVYVNVKPLLDHAYRDLGNLNSDFDKAIVKAIETLADTPRPVTEPVLLSRPGYFEHDDPTLKALLPVQRQFLLVGPENQRQILGWLRRLASSLDLNIR